MRKAERKFYVFNIIVIKMDANINGDCGKIQDSD